MLPVPERLARKRTSPYPLTPHILTYSPHRMRLRMGPTLLDRSRLRIHLLPHPLRDLLHPRIHLLPPNHRPLAPREPPRQPVTYEHVRVCPGSRPWRTGWVR